MPVDSTSCPTAGRSDAMIAESDESLSLPDQKCIHASSHARQALVDYELQASADWASCRALLVRCSRPSDRFREGTFVPQGIGRPRECFLLDVETERYFRTLSEWYSEVLSAWGFVTASVPDITRCMSVGMFGLYATALLWARVFKVHELEHMHLSNVEKAHLRALEQYTYVLPRQLYRYLLSVGSFMDRQEAKCRLRIPVTYSQVEYSGVRGWFHCGEQRFAHSDYYRFPCLAAFTTQVIADFSNRDPQWSESVFSAADLNAAGEVVTHFLVDWQVQGYNGPMSITTGAWSALKRVGFLTGSAPYTDGAMVSLLFMEHMSTCLKAQANFACSNFDVRRTTELARSLMIHTIGAKYAFGELTQSTSSSEDDEHMYCLVRQVDFLAYDEVVSEVNYGRGFQYAEVKLARGITSRDGRAEIARHLPQGEVAAGQTSCDRSD